MPRPAWWQRAGMILIAAAALGVAFGGGWLARSTHEAERAAPSRASASLDDLLMDLQIIPLENAPAKPFVLEGMDGQRFALADLAGRPALLYFWATWCPYCSRELPSTIESITREFGPRGLVVLAIDIQESRQTVAGWLAGKSISPRVLLDGSGEVTSAYGVTATPTVFVVTRDGRLAGKALGTKAWSGETGRTLLRGLLAP
jgi:thiol-disulfide isomerase/thioredoxin